MTLLSRKNGRPEGGGTIVDIVSRHTKMESNEWLNRSQTCIGKSNLRWDVKAVLYGARTPKIFCETNGPESA